jgi:hypothetical protein
MIRTFKKFFNLVLSGLITAIAINYLILGTIDYFHSINDLLIWIKQSGMGDSISKFFGGR